MLTKKQIPRLTDEQRQLVADNLGCAKAVCNKMQNYIILHRIEDPLEVCYLRMVECARLYAPEKGAVSTFFYRLCRTALLIEGRKCWRECRGPQNVAYSLNDTVKDSEQNISNLDMLIDDGYDPEQVLLSKDAVDSVIRHLRSFTRRVKPMDLEIYLAHINGEKYRDIAPRYGVSFQAVALRGKKVERLVRERFAKEYES